LSTQALIEGVFERVAAITDGGEKAKRLEQQQHPSSLDETGEPLAKRQHVEVKSAVSGFLADVVTVHVASAQRVHFSVTFRDNQLQVAKGRRVMSWRVDAVHLALTSTSVEAIVMDMLDDHTYSSQLSLLDWICVERLARRQTPQSIARGASPYVIDLNNMETERIPLSEIRAILAPLSFNIMLQ
jgi:hypothetical protein